MLWSCNFRAFLIKKTWKIFITNSLWKSQCKALIMHQLIRVKWYEWHRAYNPSLCLCDHTFTHKFFWQKKQIQHKDSKTQRLKDSKTQRLKDSKTQRRIIDISPLSNPSTCFCKIDMLYWAIIASQKIYLTLNLCVFVSSCSLCWICFKNASTKSMSLKAASHTQSIVLL